MSKPNRIVRKNGDTQTNILLNQSQVKDPYPLTTDPALVRRWSEAAAFEIAQITDAPTLCFSGTSGAVVAHALYIALSRIGVVAGLMHVAKSDRGHHRDYIEHQRATVESTKVFVDDFIVSAATFRRVEQAIKKYSSPRFDQIDIVALVGKSHYVIDDVPYLIEGYMPPQLSSDKGNDTIGVGYTEKTEQAPFTFSSQ